MKKMFLMVILMVAVLSFTGCGTKGEQKTLVSQVI